MLGINLWSFLSTFNPVTFFTGNLIKFAAGAAVVTMFFMWDHERVSRHEQKGRQGAISDVNNANTQSTKAGQASADSSGKPGSAGVQRSPRYR